jgi:hypothetical protein
MPIVFPLTRRDYFSYKRSLSTVTSFLISPEDLFSLTFTATCAFNMESQMSFHNLVAFQRRSNSQTPISHSPTLLQMPPSNNKNITHSHKDKRNEYPTQTAIVRASCFRFFRSIISLPLDVIVVKHGWRWHHWSCCPVCRSGARRGLW